MAKKIAKKNKTQKESLPIVTNDKVGAYLNTETGKLVKIEWEHETEKMVKATGGKYKDSPLKKDKVLVYHQHAVDEYNQITDHIEKLQAQQAKLLEKLGRKF